jgi:threonyl-tRNA synthetase
MMHVNAFSCKITEKGRSRFTEPPEPAVTSVGEALLVLTSVEKDDELNPAMVAQRAADEIAANADNLKVHTIVIHPHLFAELGKSSVAVEVMQEIRNILAGRGYDAIRTPFGWFNTLEISAKGHPYSRVARIIRAYN